MASQRVTGWVNCSYVVGSTNCSLESTRRGGKRSRVSDRRPGRPGRPGRGVSRSAARLSCAGLIGWEGMFQGRSQSVQRAMRSEKDRHDASTEPPPTRHRTVPHPTPVHHDTPASAALNFSIRGNVLTPLSLHANHDASFNLSLQQEPHRSQPSTVTSPSPPKPQRKQIESHCHCHVIAPMPRAYAHRVHADRLILIGWDSDAQVAAAREDQGRVPID